MSDFIAKFNCPGCGSPLQSPEGSISLRCTFCGLAMRIGCPGRILKYYFDSRLNRFGAKFAIEKYLKENNLSLQFREIGHQLYHLPFYRFRGMSYSIFIEKSDIEADPETGIQLPAQIKYNQKCRHFDITVPAFSNQAFGLDSLGVRPEVVPLTAFQNEQIPENSNLLDVDLEPKAAIQRSLAMNFFNLGYTDGKEELVTSEMIGEGLSLIYYPAVACSIQRGDMQSTMFVDGLSKRVYNEIPEVVSSNPKGLDLSKSSCLSPVQHKCPNCGFDFPVSENSLFYHCANCFRSFMLSDDKYMSVPMPAAAFEQSQAHFPFWRIPLQFENMTLVKHFSKFLTGEIPLIAKQKAENPFLIYVPAFKVADLRSISQKAISMTCMQPLLTFEDKSVTPASEMILPAPEAMEMARFIWNAIRFKYRQISGEKFAIQDGNLGQAELVWLTLSMSAAFTKNKKKNIPNSDVSR